MQSEYAILYLEINVISLVLVGLILHRTTGLSKMVAQRNFAMSIVAEMVFFLSDTIYVLINTGTLRFGILNRFLMLMCKEVYFFSTAAMCFFWFIYFEYLRDTGLVKEKKTIRIASCSLWITGILLIINIFTGFLFYIDSDSIYHRGPCFILMYILPYSYVIVSCVRTVMNMRDPSYTGDRHTLVMLALFPLAPGIAGFIQFVYPRLPVACGVLAITTLILYLNWIDQLISLDPLTGLNNRKQLTHFYEQWTKNRTDGDTINVLMIDADKFKTINDTYGHIKGDMALKNIAEAIRLGCRILPVRANISRYGGDEFAVLFESDDPGDAMLLKKTITDELKHVNERTKIPFELTVSIGAASSNGELLLKELIDMADEAMYEDKNNNRK